MKQRALGRVAAGQRHGGCFGLLPCDSGGNGHASRDAGLDVSRRFVNHVGVPSEEWQRLADLLVNRRISLGFPRRAPFLRIRKSEAFERIAVDLEAGTRTNYERSPLGQAEWIYGWMPGSIRAVLAGGDPEPLDPSFMDDSEQSTFAAEPGLRTSTTTRDAELNAGIHAEIDRMEQAIGGRYRT